MNHKGQLRNYEREKIFLYLEQGYSFREIGSRIGRDHTVISREVQRNRDEW
jgi:IS30 family transposase